MLELFNLHVRTAGVGENSMEALEGTLNHIRFQNDKNFLIGMFQDGKREHCALGVIHLPEAGQIYRLFGKWMDDSKWGRQFKFDRYEIIIPKDELGIFRYLVKTAKFVGPIVGKRIIDKYGDTALDVLTAEPERVASEISGITLTRAHEIQKALIDNKALESVMVELEATLGGTGIRRSVYDDLITRFGVDAVKVLKEQPYDVLCSCNGCGFLTADKVAIDRLSIDRQDIGRQKAAVLHALEANQQGGGHTWMKTDVLLTQAQALIGYVPQAGYVQLLRAAEIVDAQPEQLTAKATTAAAEAEIATIIKEFLSYGI